ncbi:MAG: hypothetical protein WCD69_25150 [Xanthobacteraceae bacterium]
MLQKLADDLADDGQHIATPPLPPDDYVISTAFAAKVAGMSPYTLSVKLRTGKGPPFVRFSAKKFGIRVSDLKAWIASRVVQIEPAE